MMLLEILLVLEYDVFDTPTYSTRTRHSLVLQHLGDFVWAKDQMC